MRVSRYQLDGVVTNFGRRDMRRGKAVGRAEATPLGIVCLSRWDDPLPGTATLRLLTQCSTAPACNVADMHDYHQLLTWTGQLACV